MKVLVKTLLITLSIIVAAFAGIFIYSKWKTNKENEHVYSEELEVTNGILKIRLGDDIRNYKGFEKLSTHSQDLDSKLDIWVHCGYSELYNTVGGFPIRSLSMEKLKLEIEDAEAAKKLEGIFGCSNKYLFVYTTGYKISKIRVQIEEKHELGSSSNFNYVLERIYGPTSRSIKFPNEIINNIQDGQSVFWESKNVALDSKNIIVTWYTKLGNIYSIDYFKQLTYTYKPLEIISDRESDKSKEADEVRKSL